MAAAMIDRIVHHAEVLTLTGASDGSPQRRRVDYRPTRVGHPLYAATGVASGAWTTRVLILGVYCHNV